MKFGPWLTIIADNTRESPDRLDHKQGSRSGTRHT